MSSIQDNSTGGGTALVLSLKNDDFKSTLYRHFRLLGTRRDKNEEIKAQKSIFDEILKDVQDEPKFYKLRDHRRVTVSRDEAFAFILETIQRRHSTTHLWMEKVKLSKVKGGARKTASKQPSPLNEEKEKESDQSEDETLASIAASKRKSPRLKVESKPPNSSSGSNQQSSDILLSMLDPYYKQTIFHYYDLRKQDSNSNTLTASDEIYVKFTRYLKRTRGKFYKIGHRGGERYLVDSEDEILKKIKTDLNKSNRYQKEMSATIVLDLNRDSKYAAVMYRYYNVLDPGANEAQEKNAANQAFDELRQKFSFFVKIVGGDRVDISEQNDLISSTILQSIKRRKECKSQWFGKVMHEKQPIIPNRKRPIQSSRTDYLSTSSIIPRKRQATSTISPQQQQHNQQPMIVTPMPATSEIRSFLDDRLPNRKLITINHRTSIDKVSQLVQILQLATHKLNDLHGTIRRHCKVIRLHQLPELGGKGVGIPPLAELAKHMSISQSNIRKWFEMCQNAEKRGFDLRLLGDDRIDLHSEIFEDVERDDDMFVLEHSVERAIKVYFDEVVHNVLGDIESSHAYKSVRSSLDEVKESDDEIDYEIDMDLSGKVAYQLISQYGNKLLYQHETPPKCSRSSGTSEITGDQDSLEPLLVDNDSDISDKQNEEESKDSYKQMKFSITRSLIAAGYKSKLDKNRSDIAQTKSTTRNSDNLFCEGTVSRQYHSQMLRGIERGTRIIVKWKDSLFKATVKKVRKVSDDPLLKVHYDGKKSHIIDNISWDMVYGIITDEKMRPKDSTQAPEDPTMPQYQGVNRFNVVAPSSANRDTNHFGADSFSPLMMGHSTQAIEDSHSDHEFLTSLMDEKGLLFGDEELEDDVSAHASRDRCETLQTTANESLEACALKPLKSSSKFSSTYPKEEGNVDIVKNNLHFSEENIISDNNQGKKKGISPRMKHNKKSLIGGVMPIFALDIAPGAELSSESASNKDSTALVGVCPRVVKTASLHSTTSPLLQKLSPIKNAHEPSSIASYVRISPISLHSFEADVPRPQLNRPDGHELTSAHTVTENSNTKSSISANEVSTFNIKPAHSAFISVPRTSKPGLEPSNFLPSTSPLKMVSSDADKAENVQLFAFEYDSGKTGETIGRPKRKLKAIVRYDPDMAQNQAHGCKTGSGFTCPRCEFTCDYSSKLCSRCQLECYYEAGVGVVSLKNRDSVGANQTILPFPKKSKVHLSRQEGVLCNCTYCARCHFSIQGIYAHHGRAHGQTEGTRLDWSKVTFSCPFCKSLEKLPLNKVEKHVRDYHPGCKLLTPNTDKPSRNKHRSKISITPQPSFNVGSRSTRTKQIIDTPESPETIPRWTKLNHRSLLPDSKKDYPSEIPNILSIIEEQCKAQEGEVAHAREQRLKLCKIEATLEAKILDDDRLAYLRGIRERSRHADAERIEKERYTESQSLELMQYEYENRNRKRTQDEIEIDKLCSKPIVFSNVKGRHLPSEKNSCKYNHCELCNGDSSYLQSVMLDTEMAIMKSDNSSSQSLLRKANILQPSFQAIDKDYFTEAEEQFEDEAYGKNNNSSKKSKQSRRDVTTSKRLRIEEDKLFKMRSNQHSLEFIHRYNEGLIRNAWKTAR